MQTAVRLERAARAQAIAAGCLAGAAGAAAALAPPPPPAVILVPAPVCRYTPWGYRCW